ncbi:MAG TPA: prenyltransferase/squalene oxidase repeat-containing protein [Solirubrobacterales bacterium]|nr:prenyltransferase/squalene oxidase repeat-containing protein [Solirubrobacterales bacterium]
MAFLSLALLLLGAGGEGTALAAGNASRAAAFLESAQNSDGGFGAKQGDGSDPIATLWASLALEAAGKNPGDEFLKNGHSADQYIAAHSGETTSLEGLGLMALVGFGGRFPAGHYGDPVAKITAALSEEALRQDPEGAAIAALGLLAAGTPEAEELAASTARTLLERHTSDGAWGPSGNADSAATALALQLIAKTGVANAEDPVVAGAVEYLKAAQANDGAIAASTRIASAGGHGSVPATAFTVQALAALGLPPITTETGKTVRYGLTQYQQQSTGGLSSDGSIYSPVRPSVAETAMAFPAFNGDTFPLTPVAAVTAGPEAAKKGTKASKEAGEGHDTESNRVSSGTSKTGVSSSTGTETESNPGAFEKARAESAGHTAGKKASAKPERKGKKGEPEKERPRQKSANGGEGSGGPQVSGTVVGTESAPALKAKAGALDDGLSNKQKAVIALGVLLAALLVAGVVAERMRPRPAGAPPLALAATGAVLRPTGRGLWRAGGFAARHAETGSRFTVRRRPALIALAAIGVALVVFPLATGMFGKAPKGATMVSAFAPYMEQQRLDGYVHDFDQVKDFAAELQTKAPALLLPGVKDAEERKERFLKQSPEAALFLTQWPKVDHTLGGMLGTIQANRGNYEAVAALPSFRLFPWFFVIPGALLIALALGGLLFARRRPRSWVPVRRAAIAIGVCLCLAPLIFGMFSRAPRGQAMVSAFKTVETRKLVEEVQSDFGTVAIGQGVVAGEIWPKLEAGGLSAGQIAKKLPASEDLNKNWTKILNDLTPMIGVMSDNVANYRAVVALPPFGLFPWLFLVAGLAALGLALVAGRMASAQGTPPPALPPERSGGGAEPPRPAPPAPPTARAPRPEPVAPVAAMANGTGSVPAGGALSVEDHRPTKE